MRSDRRFEYVSHHQSGRDRPVRVVAPAVFRTVHRPGEAETIALALEKKADLVLLDEKEGRRAATRLGLRVTGVVGVLLDAKGQSYLRIVQPLLDRLRSEAGFYISDGLYRTALKLAGED